MKQFINAHSGIVWALAFLLIGCRPAQENSGNSHPDTLTKMRSLLSLGKPSGNLLVTRVQGSYSSHRHESTEEADWTIGVESSFEVYRCPESRDGTQKKRAVLRLTTGHHEGLSGVFPSSQTVFPKGKRTALLSATLLERTEKASETRESVSVWRKAAPRSPPSNVLEFTIDKARRRLLELKFRNQMVPVETSEELGEEPVQLKELDEPVVTLLKRVCHLSGSLL